MSKKIHGLSKRNWKCFFVGFVLAWLCAGGCCAAVAGVPVKFTVETSRADVQEINCYHGETLDFDVAFKNYGKDLYFPTNAEAQIFWQTNGMSAFYWRTNNVNVVSNHMMATFLPEMDPGAGTVFGFIGIPGDIYRASFVLRMKMSPGVKPKEMEWPYRTLDFSQVEVRNAPYYDKEETEERLATKVGKVGDQEIDGALHVTGNLTVDGTINESDPTVPDWAKNPNPPVTVEEDPVFEGWKQTSEVVIGRNTTSAGLYGVSIGANSRATSGRSVAVGESAKASGGDYAIAIGNAQASARGAVAIGLTASASGYQATAIGYGANASRANTIVLGNSTMTAESIYIGPLTLQSYFDAIEADKLYSKDGKKYVDANGDVWYQTNLVYYVNNFNPIPMLNLYPVGNNTWQTMHGVDYGECRVRWDGSKWHFAYANDGDLQTDWFEYSVSPSYITLTSADIYDDAPTSRSFKRMTTNGWVRLQQTAYKNDLEHYVPKTRKINGKTLDKDITIDAGGVKKVANKSPDAQGNVALTPADIGAATTEEEQATRAIVTTWEQFLDGSNVVFSITNYISGTYNLGAAKMRITELRDGAYREVYNSRDEILLHIDHFSNSYVRVALDAVVEEVAQRLADKADRAWGNHTSAGGNAPSNTVYMTAPNTVFAGGMEYERVAVGQGAVCVLTTKGAPVYTQGDEGTFKFQDDGGTNYFGFAKTDSYVIGCNTDGISVQNQIVTLEYDVTMSGVPCIWYRESLQGDSPWVQCNTPDGEPISGAPKVVQWEQNPGAGKEICYINCSEASGFFKATIEVAGEAKFMTNMKADLNGGVLCTDGQTVIYPHANGSWSTTK